MVAWALWSPLCLDPIFPCFLRKVAWPVFSSPFNICHQGNLLLLGAPSNSVLAACNRSVNTGPATQSHVCFSYPGSFPHFTLIYNKGLSLFLKCTHQSQTLRFIHSLHSSPCPSPTFLSSGSTSVQISLKDLSDPHIHFIWDIFIVTLHHSSYLPLEPRAAWCSSLSLWLHLRIQERHMSSGGAEKETPGAACRVSQKVLREAGMQSLTRASRSCALYCLLFPLVSPFLSFFFPFIFISWRLINLQYCSGFCHTLTWISHGFTCISHPDPPSHLPVHPIPLGLPSAPGPSTCIMHPAWAGDLFHPR